MRQKSNESEEAYREAGEEVDRVLVSHTRICTLSLSDSRRRKNKRKIDDFTRTHTHKVLRIHALK